jgi:hypothetical protein
MARRISVFLLLLFHLTLADDIATNTPVPPLQWINLTNLLRGNSPPPLKDAAIGYDEVRYIFFFDSLLLLSSFFQSLHYSIWG